MIHLRRLRWDDRNMAHIARHGVTAEEAEEVCHGDFFLLQGKKRRIMLIGPTSTGRILALVLEHEGEGDYYPVTARPASRKERRWYREQQEEV
jgi:uncharacterized DUF497 family protein